MALTKANEVRISTLRRGGHFSIISDFKFSDLQDKYLRMYQNSPGMEFPLSTQTRECELKKNLGPSVLFCYGYQKEKTSHLALLLLYTNISEPHAVLYLMCNVRLASK
uniref:AlNc14C62G4524 protein n=1 Tax=Albugo laibachii Nc14 TaxID=890382 RepID=F0WD01_9STRA|nr:AlNc14C62G4524 [Albugo laibachii Nc14]|eukprot:CCA19072.1 AlNc14C62G4524 [Albugo laibachii Nc14]